MAVIRLTNGGVKQVEVTESRAFGVPTEWPCGVYSVSIDGMLWTYEMVKRQDGKIVPWNGRPLYGSMLYQAIRKAFS